MVVNMVRQTMRFDDDIHFKTSSIAKKNNHLLIKTKKYFLKYQNNTLRMLDIYLMQILIEINVLMNY